MNLTINRPHKTADDLSDMIRKEILSGGIISFRDFMEMALYHPDLGYYMSEREKIGWGGDFFTSPDMNDVFGISIMKQLSEMRSMLAPDGPFHVIEAGAGKGNLCSQILSAARDRDPELLDQIRYVIVERSPQLARLQKETLELHGLQEMVGWSDDIVAALEERENAVVFSNELIDAFPVHRVRFNGKRWEELYVDVDGSDFSEKTAPLSSSLMEEYLSKLEGPFEDGYTTEINLDGMAWIKNIGTNLKRGMVITIDYGYPRGDYYSPLRRDGTLLCYHKHTTSDNPYKRVGDQDITSHVDFTSLVEAGNEAGLELTGYCEQFHFLMGLGIFDELHDLGKSEEYDINSYQQNAAMKKLFMPESMGGTFKVLIQHKGMDRPDLKAFSFKDLSHRLFV